MNDTTNDPPSNATKPAKGTETVVPIDRVERLRNTVKAAMNRRGLTMKGFAEELQVSRPAFGRWLAGKPRRGEAKRVSAAVAEWLEEEKHGAEESDDAPVAECGVDEFVETPTSERIASALAYAKANRDMAVIYGGPGVGKTRTIREFTSLYENVWVVTATPATSGVVPCLEEVSDAVGLKEPGGGARRLSRAIRARVEPLEGLLIVDEAQHLTTSAIEELRSIHDACGLAIAFVGNETVYGRMGGARSAQFAQLASRLGLRVPFIRPDEKDVRAVARAWGVTDEAAVATLIRVAMQPGALRGVVKVLRLASAKGRVSEQNVRVAVDHLGIEV